MPKVEDGKLSDFRPQKDNANAHTQRGLKALSGAYSEVGYVAPMTAAANGEVLDGSARLEQAFDQFDDEALVIRHDGSRPIVMIREDVEDSDDPRAKKISYGANRIGEIDLNWDPAQLLLDKEAGVDFSSLFYENELDEITAEAKKEPLEESPPPVDKAAELQEKWQCQPDQIWQIESAINPAQYHRLICGDCRDMETVKRLTEGRKVCLCLTDPPYGIDINSNAKIIGVATDRSRKATDDKWDKSIPDKEAFDLIFAFSENQIVFGANYFWEYFYSSSCYIVWDKRGDLPSVPFADTEFAWTSFANKPNKRYVIINHGFIRDEKEERFHPTQKPVKLFRSIINDFTEINDTVYDPFLGSGTTLMGCEQLGRLCRGIEISPPYVAVCLERYKQAFGIEASLVT